MNEYQYKLWKPTVESADVRFLHIDDMPNSGFVSVYSYTKNDADSMQQLDTYKGFKGSVYSKDLLIDCDTEEASQNVERWLQGQGIGYEKYTTGNRGNHFHVSRLATASHLLPRIDKEFVSTTFVGVDLSIYHHVAMYRQEGATHKKTGKRKEKTATIPGKALDMQKSTFEDTYESISGAGSGEMQSVFTDKVLKNMTVPIAKGERRARYIEIGLALHRLGQPIEFALAYLANVNLMAEEMLNDRDMERILDWVYNKRS